MAPDAVLRKIARLRGGSGARVLDLFAGCGGISLGFQAAGFAIRAAVESDPHAARSHAINFHGGDGEHSRARDIITTTPETLTADLDLGPAADAIDVIVGGPPCQAFARIGRPKLREIAAHPQAFRRDPRARLYQEYLRYVDAFQPLAVLIENVPDVLNHGGQNVAQDICEVLTDKGYVCGYTLLNAAHYGVPQMRERMFLIAYRREITAGVSFPAPTHWLLVPPGYQGSRAVALKLLNGLLLRAHNYSESPAADPDSRSAVTAEQALGDLPPIHARQLLAAGGEESRQRRVDATHPLDLYADFEAPDRPGLIAVCGSRPPACRPLRVLAIEYGQRTDGRWSLRLSLHEPRLLPVFAALCRDIVSFTRSGVDEGRLAAAVVGRINHWRTLLERDVAGLGEAALRGLIGELLVLEQQVLAALPLREAVAAWTGPQGSPQDFLLPAGARIEVKTIGRDAGTVHVNGLLQLDAGLDPLTLTVVRIETTGVSAPQALTAPVLIARLRDRISADPDALADFEATLARAGWHESG